MRKKYILIAALFGICSISAVNYNNDRLFEIIKNIEIFTNIYHELNTHYVDDLDPNELMRTGIDAMMNSLDPYTVYYSESQVESYRISTEGKYNGLGAKSATIGDAFTIVELYENGPAKEAGLVVGDQIIAVNGKSAKGKTYDEVFQIIRGFPGTDLNVTIKKPLTSEEENVTITRRQVKVPNVPHQDFITDDVGYIALTTFTKNAGKNIAKAFRGMKEKNPDMKGLVLDLRSNGGGLLSEAVDILGIFLPKGSLVVTTKGKVIERDRSYNTRRSPIDTEMPLIVLTNKSSASASEIVSGSIQDYDRGIVMGQRTFGKGLVQNHREIGYNSRIKVTTSKYYIPSGRCIQSREYEDGEPKFIPDEERAVFYTKNKRPVLDGGGVAADVEIKKPEDTPYMKAIKKNHLVFKYVTKYLANNTLPDTIADLKFEKYDDFIAFINSESIDYQLATEEKLEDVKSAAEKEGLLPDVSAQLEEMITNVQSKKIDDQNSHKDETIALIEQEIAQRLFYQGGKTQVRLRGDNEVEEAIALINNTSAYQTLLKPL